MVWYRLSVCVSLVILCSIDVRALKKEKCNNCVPAEQCTMYKELIEEERRKWRERFDCENSETKDEQVPIGFSSDAKGDLVCCPENVWGVESPNLEANKKDGENKTNPDLDKRGGAFEPNKNAPVSSGKNNQNIENGDKSDFVDVDGNSDIDANRAPYWQRRGQNIQNPYFLPANGNGNSFKSNSRGQCPVISFPPDPATGCCGLEASEEDEINSQPRNTGQNQNFINNGWNNWMPKVNNWLPSWFSGAGNTRNKRDQNASVEIDNRIAGGKETDLDQFPWTVLLKTTFVYPNKEAAFACGGSLISSRYVLTAGHCVFDAEGSIKGIEVTLAEYDKRTFPKDCKFQLGRGEVCVENIIMQAEDYVLHPEYDDNRLNNDIAVVRLRGNAPYNNYIRPICLPPIDIDSPDLVNLRLAVAGWGRNGDSKSDIKQSTVVNLVPQSECKNSYPHLTRKSVCAAGYSGEDTCKGDSGGPLMMKYKGKYYLSGVVSGKRADAPCGTSVPSLYTNVFQYVNWIRSVIRN